MTVASTVAGFYRLGSTRRTYLTTTPDTALESALSSMYLILLIMLGDPLLQLHAVRSLWRWPASGERGHDAFYTDARTTSDLAQRIVLCNVSIRESVNVALCPLSSNIFSASAVNTFQEAASCRDQHNNRKLCTYYIVDCHQWRFRGKIQRCHTNELRLASIARCPCHGAVLCHYQQNSAV